MRAERARSGGKREAGGRAGGEARGQAGGEARPERTANTGPAGRGFWPFLAATLLAPALLWSALWPLSRVIVPGPWAVQVIVMPLAIAVAGIAIRSLRISAPGAAAAIAQLLVWAGSMMLLVANPALLFGGPAPLGAGGGARSIDEVLVAAAAELRDGVAPMAADVPLQLVLVAAAGLLAILIDQVLLTLRVPVAALLPIVALFAVPLIVVPGDVPWPAFALTAAVFVALLRALAIDDARRALLRDGAALALAAAGPTPGGAGARDFVEQGFGERGFGARSGGAAASIAALSIGAAALALALLAPAVLPQPTPGALPGTAGVISTAISPTLNLGDDLREPVDTPVARVWGSDSPPYLRAHTLSTFTGRSWSPDRNLDLPIGPGTLRPPALAPGIDERTVTATIAYENLASPVFPVPFQVSGIEGLGSGWRIRPDNATIVTDDGVATGASATVTWRVADPTVTQLRELRAASDDERLLDVDGDPALVQRIAGVARERTAQATNDYDRLIALQDWFRSPDFNYSLDAPVADDFDGSGLEAISQFLDERSGYCVHFASAFAVMARTLGIPTRIVVGYLPGAPTGEVREGEEVFQVTSRQLHAWPEAEFDGVGWVAFEPTNSLGVATDFLTDAEAQARDEAESPRPEPSVSATPTAPPSAAPSVSAPAPLPSAPEDDAADDESPAASAPFDARPLWGALITLGVLAVLLAPAGVREVLRRSRRRAAGRGDAVAAWRELAALVRDLGLAPPQGASPRRFGDALVADAGADPAATRMIVRSIEWVSYAPAPGSKPSRAGFVPADAHLDRALDALRASLFEAAGPGASWTARLVPRSLLRRRR